MRAGKRHICPCCGFATLNAPDAFEVCPVCLWEDDGTLAKALEDQRAHFADHAHAYSVSEAPLEAISPSSARTELISYVMGIRSGEEKLDPVLLESLLLAVEISREID